MVLVVSLRRVARSLLTILPLSWALSAAQVAQASGVDDVLIQAPTLSAPERGSVAGTYGATAFAANDLPRGTFELPGPFSAPSERGGLLAPVFPSYSPDSGQTEWGLGWANNLTITRSALVGPIDYAADEYTSPWGRLVLAADGYYYATGLTGAVRLRLSAGKWEAILPDGTHMHYEPLVEHEQGTYAWHLVRAVDVLGETTTVAYELNASGRPFLKTVTYGGRASGDYRISFTYKSITHPFVDFRSGEGLELDRRVDRVLVEARDTDTGSYVPRDAFDLSYKQGLHGPAFYLEQVTRSYASGHVDPPFKYTYDLGENQLTGSPVVLSSLESIVAATGTWAFSPSYMTFTDLERDGQPELEYRGLYQVARKKSTGWTFEPLPPATGTEHARCRPPVQQSRSARNLAHLTGGDGEPLVFAARNVPGFDGSELVVCDRAGKPLYEVGLSGRWELGPNTRLVDLDRDDRPDIVRVQQGGYQVLRNISHESTLEFSPAGFEALDLSFAPAATWIVDINGDGVGDVVAAHGAGLTVFHGHGDLTFSFEKTQMRFTTKSGLPFTNLSDREILFTDINKDGLEDVVLQRGRQLSVYVNLLHGFQEVAAPALSSLPLGASSPTFGDPTGSGESQAVYIYKKQAYGLNLSSPSTGLLVAADDGKGARLTFGYGRGPVGPGMGQRAVVISKLTVEASGLDSASYAYDYFEPVVHSRARYLVGFGTTRRTLPFTSEETQFYHDDDVSSVPIASLASDARSPNAARFALNSYSDRSFNGVRWLRPLSEQTGWRSTLTGAEVSQTVRYTDYVAEVCPSAIETDNEHGKVRVEATRANPAALAQALHCLPSSELETAEHPDPDPSLDASVLTSFVRNARGQIERLTAESGAQKLLLQEIHYDALHRIDSVFVPDEGTSNIAYDGETSFVTEIETPDGVRTTAEYDPRLDLMTRLTVDRGTVWNRFFAYDKADRLERWWDDLTSPTLPMQRLTYGYADALRPAHVRTGLRRSATSYLETVDYLTANGDMVGSAQRVPGGWSPGALVMRSPESGQQRTYRRPLVPGEAHNLTYAQLLGSADELDLTVSTAFEYASSEHNTVQNGVERTMERRLDVVAGERIITETENGLFVTRRGIDCQNAVLWSENEAGERTTFRYDALGRVVEVVLADGASHRMRYDDFGRPEVVERDQLASIAYAYDPVSTLPVQKTVADADGALDRTVTWEHDNAGRVLLETHQLEETGEVRTFSFSYDGLVAGAPAAAGQLGYLSQVEGDGFERHAEYDRRGRLARSSVSIDGFRTLEEKVGYFDDGTEQSHEWTTRDSQGMELDKTRLDTELDTFGRVAALRLNGQSLAKLHYGEDGRLEQVAFTGGRTVAFDYDELTREQRGIYSDASVWSAGVDWTLDARGGMASEQYMFGDDPLTRNYAYDERGFLASVKEGTKTTAEYGYDTVGRVDFVSDEQGARDLTRTGSSRTVKGKTYTYDKLGRVVQRGTQSFAYGPTGELETATEGSVTLGYVYDEQGWRLAKSRNGKAVEAYLNGAFIDEQRLVLPLKVVGHLVGVIVDGSFELLATDRRGTVFAEEGSARLASPYGVRATRPELSAALDYIEHGYDRDLGTVRFGVRDYDPLLSEFWTPDPLFLESLEECVKSPTECNLYAYARNDPLSFTDPEGTVAGGIIRATAKKGLSWLAKHGGKLSKHIINRHIRRRIEVDGTKFITTRGLNEMIEATIKGADNAVVQMFKGNVLFQKEFGHAIGKGGQRILSVVISQRTGKLITTFPTHSWAIAAAFGIISFTADEARAEHKRRQEIVEARGRPDGFIETVGDMLFGGTSAAGSCSTVKCQKWLDGAPEEFEKKLHERIQEDAQQSYSQEDLLEMTAVYYDLLNAEEE